LRTAGRRFPLICLISGDRIIITFFCKNPLLETTPAQSYSHQGSTEGDVDPATIAARRVSPIFPAIPARAARPASCQLFLPKMPDAFQPNFARNLPLTFLHPSGTIFIT
jgi:hypothetical protein